MSKRGKIPRHEPPSQPPPMKIYGEKQERCTTCNSSEVEWMNQFCQECWERYTSEQWWVVIQAAGVALAMAGEK